MNGAGCHLPGVSIVVPVYNGEACMASCLESLLKQDYPQDLYEIIVVDNNSRDNTREIVGGYPVRLLEEKRQGAGPARNTGWRSARFEIVAFTDSDCTAEPDWLKILAPLFHDKRLGAAGGRLVPAPPQTLIEEYIIAKDILSQERAMKDEPLSPPFLVTANAMFRKSCLEEAGGFDEDLSVSGEDADLCWRVGWKGHEIRFEPRARVYHHHRSSLRGLLSQIRSYGAGTSWLFHKHGKHLGFERCFIREVYYEMGLSLLRIIPGMIMGKTRLERWTPMLDFLGAAAFLRGKLFTSIKLGIRFY